MKFDGNQAWKQAAAWVSANRDVLVALAGVFLLVPELAVGMFAPQPAVTAGMSAEQIVALSRSYYIDSLPLTLPMLLLQALGTLAMLALFTDRRRPTVGQSIRQGLTGIVTYILAQVLLGIGIGVVAGLVAVIAAFTGSRPALVVMIVIVAAAAIYVTVRTSLSGPVIAVEQVRNPVAALTRSWRLTRGNSGRLVLFYLILGVVFVVVTTVAKALLGTLLALMLGPANGTMVLGVILAVLSTAITTYLIAVLGAVHRQLAGTPLAEQRTTFE